MNAFAIEDVAIFVNWTAGNQSVPTLGYKLFSQISSLVDNGKAESLVELGPDATSHLISNLGMKMYAVHCFSGANRVFLLKETISISPFIERILGFCLEGGGGGGTQLSGLMETRLMHEIAMFSTLLLLIQKESLVVNALPSKSYRSD